MKILVTGTAGFIGFHLAKRLLKAGYEVIGLDNINDYYEQNLKYGRLAATGIEKKQIAYNKLISSKTNANYQFIQLDLADSKCVAQLFKEQQFNIVCNLAAQAGVRYSLENPHAYVKSNVLGFLNILEGCRQNNIKNLVYASSSSVYGNNKQIPFSTEHPTDQPVSLYAATKKSNELMAHSYNHLYNIQTTGLRFFTVYGPWGRPDMAYFLFTKAILRKEAIKVFNKGDMSRDFTYIDDIVEGIFRIIKSPIQSTPTHKVYNIGNASPINLMAFIETLEKKLGITAQKKFLPLQPGDLKTTWADVNDLVQDFGYQPNPSIEKGIGAFVDWYKKFYKTPVSPLIDSHVMK